MCVSWLASQPGSANTLQSFVAAPWFIYSVFLINQTGILENLGSNMGQKSVLNQLFEPFRALGTVRNGFAVYFSSRLSPSMLRTASKWSQNQLFPLNRSGMIKEKRPVQLFIGFPTFFYSVLSVFWWICDGCLMEFQLFFDGFLMDF